LTRYEMFISLLCLVAGYVAVSWTLDRMRPGGKAAPGAPGRAPPGGASDELRGGAGAGAGANAGTRSDPPRPAPQSAMPWYVVLDVDRSASRAQITAAYRARISQYHPDKVARMGPEIRALAEKKSAEINTAYETALRNIGGV
jgi:DnaJ like chaperone protein